MALTVHFVRRVPNIRNLAERFGVRSSRKCGSSAQTAGREAQSASFDLRKDTTMRLLTFLKGIGVGAVAMYFFDPERGTRRRALVRDKAVHTANQLGKTYDSASRDLTNRAGGLVAELQSLFSIETPTDMRVVERVRARIGHVLAHPSKVNVSARYGVVTLSGSVLVSEVPTLLQCVTGTRGVVGVRNELMASRVSGADPENMGEVVVMTRQNAPLHWSPATRLVAGTAGGAIAFYGKRQGGMLGGAISALGFGLLTRSLTNTVPVQNARPQNAAAPTNVLEAVMPEAPALAG
jgi:osmotically-inducible protein OsmY